MGFGLNTDVTMLGPGARLNLKDTGTAAAAPTLKLRKLKGEGNQGNLWFLILSGKNSPRVKMHFLNPVTGGWNFWVTTWLSRSTWANPCSLAKCLINSHTVYNFFW